MEMDITTTLTGLIAILVACLITLTVVEIVPRAQKLWQPFRENWPMEAVFFEWLVAQGVNAADQYLKSADGKAKMQYVLDYVEGQAKKYGFTFDKEAVRTMAEAKVKELKDKVIAAAAANAAKK